MKKIIALILAFAMVFSFAACGKKETVSAAKEVNVFSWAGYIDDDTLAKFESETGIHVTWTAMESIDDMILKLQNGDPSQYDIILSSDYSLGILREAGLIEKLDMSKLTNYENLNPAYLSKDYDPDNEYVVPYVSGYTMLVYDEDLVSEPITSYNDLWREDLEGNVCLLDNPRVICGMAAKTLGYSFNETEDAKLAAIAEKLSSLRNNVATVEDSSSYTLMATGQAAASFMYMPFAQMANDERVAAGLSQLKVAYPSEGMGFGIDGFVVAKGSKNYDNAMTLLNWLLKADVAAHNCEMQMYGCVNAAAEEFLADWYKNSEFINIPEEAAANAEMILTMDADTESKYLEIYTNFKNQ